MASDPVTRRGHPARSVAHAGAGRDGRLGEAVREGRRREFAAFGWKPEDVPDPQAPGTFYKSKLKWSERSEAPHSEMHEWYRALTRLRRDTPALTHVPLRDTRVEFDERSRWLSVQRPDGRVLLASREMPRNPGQLVMPPVSVAIVSAEV